MEPTLYQRKWEALRRDYARLKSYYDGTIDGLDSFGGPKDHVRNYFHATYSLKEALKEIPALGGKNGVVEQFIRNDEFAAIGIDLSNTEKHGLLNNSKSGKSIGPVNAHVHLLDPTGRDRTEVTIEIDGQRHDCLDLATKNLAAWKRFLIVNSVPMDPSLLI